MVWALLCQRRRKRNFGAPPAWRQVELGLAFELHIYLEWWEVGGNMLRSELCLQGEEVGVLNAKLKMDQPEF